jgi:hypothetical protein
MRRVIQSFIIATLLFVPLLNAKEKTKKHRYRVETIQEQSKKGFGKVFYKIGDFCFSIIAGAVSNSDSMQKLITKIEVFFNDKSQNHKILIEHFHGKIHAQIIDYFDAKQRSYKSYTPLEFEYILKQKAYTYLVSIAPDSACLVYPNDQESWQEVNQGKQSIPSNPHYTIRSDTKGDEIFYLVSSVRPIYFDEFAKSGRYRCTSRNRGIAKMAKIENSEFNDVKKIEIEIK